MRSHSSWCAVVAAVIAAGAVAISPAGALAEPTLTLAASSVVAGHDIVVSGAGWSTLRGGVRLQLEELETATPHGKPVDSPVLADGTFSGATVPVPLDTPQGTYRLVACQTCGDVDPGAPFADRQLTVLAHTLELDPTSAATGEQITASGEAWNPEGGPVYLFAAESPVCDQASALASGTPDETFAFSIKGTVPTREPGQYRFMAAQCIGSKVAASAFAPFTITPAKTTATSSPGSSATSGSVSTTNGGGSASGGSTTARPAHTSTSQHYGQFGWLALAVVAAVLIWLALRLATRRPPHGGRPPEVAAAVTYRTAPPPMVHETTPADRHDIRLLTDERYGPVISTEERR
jgi:hypothetical protein